MNEPHATTPQIYQWMVSHAKEIDHLCMQGEPLAQQVNAAYRAFYHAQRGSDRRQARRLEEYYRKTMNEYIARDLTITTRVQLRERYGVHQDDPETLYITRTN